MEKDRFHWPENRAEVIETGKACGLEPYAYLRFLFPKIPHAQTDEQYAVLLPQRLAPERAGACRSLRVVRQTLNFERE
ncbi:transposase domain-containing protein [Desulfoglaeba alkanexedens]|uniref:Transposase domain-containing protein n=1 Tax=Desulfoglaeba alkanexedens ALDC TaxID=980445 RepID=A0A4P8L219_9BACT|nr:transposase domain-containing protein [Desulfoglaeba alkanexedens ALDC]